MYVINLISTRRRTCDIQTTTCTLIFLSPGPNDLRAAIDVIQCHLTQPPLALTDWLPGGCLHSAVYYIHKRPFAYPEIIMIISLRTLRRLRSWSPRSVEHLLHSQRTSSPASRVMWGINRSSRLSTWSDRVARLRTNSGSIAINKFCATSILVQVPTDTITLPLPQLTPPAGGGGCPRDKHAAI